jgi:hypothetical protein
MTEGWQSMVDCLRCEVAEYAGLIRLYEQQQMFLFKRDAAGVLKITSAIDEQALVLLECRRRREIAACELAGTEGGSGMPTLGQILALVSEEARPLIRALVSDVNRAAARLRRVSRHNRLFLIRTIENHQELLRRLRPGCFTKVYAPNGSVTIASPPYAAFAAEG